MSTTVADCTCFNLRKAARAVTQFYDDALRPSGLRSTQFNLLSVIKIMGRANISALAEAAVMDRTTLTRNLRLLEEEGLIRVEPGTDARVREVSLTAAARTRLTGAHKYWTQAQAHMEQAMGPDRVRRMRGDLDGAIGAARQGQPAESHRITR